MNSNEGHRQRLKQRFLNSGAQALAEHELLELLLFFSIPRRDVKGIAKELLARFGSISGVLTASAEQLQLTPGIGENSSLLLKLVQLVSVDILNKNPEPALCMREPEVIQQYLEKRFIGVKSETLLLLALDREYHLLDTIVYPGGGKNILLEPADFLYPVLCCRNTRQVIIAHNHPGDVRTFSACDITATIKVKKLLNDIGITLLDHYVVSEKRLISMLKMSGGLP